MHHSSGIELARASDALRLRRRLGGFVGLLDLVSGAAAAYSFRKLRAAYTGAAVRLRENAGNTEDDFGFVGSDFDAAAVAAWIAAAGATNAYGTKFYDQSGNGDDLAQATANNQPLYVASGQNGQPVFRNQASDYLQGALSATIAQPNTVYVVGALSANHFLADGGAGGSARHALFDSGGNVSIYAGTTLPSAVNTPIALSLLAALFDGGTSVLRRNGLQIAVGNANTQSLDGVTLGARFNGASNLIGDYSEYIAYNADQTALFAAVEADINAYWGIF